MSKNDENHPVYMITKYSKKSELSTRVYNPENRTVLSDDNSMNFVYDISVDVAGGWIYLCFHYSPEGLSFSRMLFDGTSKEEIRPKARNLINTPSAITFFQE